MSASGKGTHFRGKPRPGRRVQVVYRVGDTPDVRTVTRNLGLGGAYIETAAPPAPGTPLTLSLHLPTSAQPIEVAAEVRWLGAGGPGEPPGMGVKFQGLELDAVAALNAYFGSLTGVEADDAAGDGA